MLRDVLCSPFRAQEPDGGMLQTTHPMQHQMSYLPAGSIEDLMHAAATWRSNRESSKRFYPEWKIFLTPEIRFAFLKMDRELINFVKKNCKNLVRAYILHDDPTHVDIELLLSLLETVDVLLVNPDIIPSNRTLIRDDPKQSFEKSVEYLYSINSWSFRHLWNSAAGSANRLKQLFLSGSNVSLEGLQTILKTCPGLDLLRHDGLVTALFYLHHDQLVEDALPRYQLRNLDMGFLSCGDKDQQKHIYLPADAAMVAVRLCPKAEIIRIVLHEEVAIDTILPLVEAPTVKELVVLVDSDSCKQRHRSLLSNVSPYVFARGVAPIVRRHGMTLKHLHISSLNAVDVGFLLSSCPYLEVLKLTDNSYVDNLFDLPFSYSDFQNLTFLQLQSLHSPNLNSICWRQLLNAQKLTCLCLDPFDADFEVLENVLNTTDYKELGAVFVGNSDTITNEHLLSLLTGSSKLRKMKILRCTNIGENEIKCLKEIVRELGLQVEVIAS